MTGVQTCAPSDLIFDADKEGFLRSVRSLIQTCGRASRNANGRVIMYADKITASIQITLDLTDSRRKKQEAYNKKHGIVPKTIFRKIAPSFAPVELNDMLESDSYAAEETPVYETVINMEEKIAEFEEEMHEAAESLEFERAAELRDRIAELREKIEKDYLHAGGTAQLPRPWRHSAWCHRRPHCVRPRHCC